MVSFIPLVTKETPLRSEQVGKEESVRGCETCLQGPVRGENWTPCIPSPLATCGHRTGAGAPSFWLLSAPGWDPGWKVAGSWGLYSQGTFLQGSCLRENKCGLPEGPTLASQKRKKKNRRQMLITWRLSCWSRSVCTRHVRSCPCLLSGHLNHSCHHSPR